MDVPAIFLRILTLQNDPVPFALISLFTGLLAPFLGIAFGFDAISSERSQGTLPRLLSQPIHRDEVIIGKFVAGLSIVAVTLFAMGLFITGVGMFRLGITPTSTEIARFFVWIVVAILYVGFWQALAILISTRAGAATAVLLALGFWLVVGLFGGLIFQVAGDVLAPQDDPLGAARAEFVISRLSPVTLFAETSSILLDPTVQSVNPFTTAEQVDRAITSDLSLSQSLSIAWPQVVGLLAMTGVLFGLAFVSFMRQEVRA
jgi:ABC-2 type transport system permease protein